MSSDLPPVSVEYLDSTAIIDTLIARQIAALRSEVVERGLWRGCPALCVALFFPDTLVLVGAA